MQAFVRFMAMDGPFVTPEIVKDHRHYRRVALAAMQSGEKPTHYSTGKPSEADRSPVHMAM
jgi:hypothetical protein